MSQIFDSEGNVTPVTLVEAGPCYVLQKKTKEKDGYDAVQVGFEEKKEKKYRYVKEKKVFSEKLKEGDKIDVSVFEEGDNVQVSGISKAKGFQGAVKRWGFSGRNATHGVKHEHRTLGSIGSAYPQRVIKGRKMPGRTGGKRVTTKNLKVIKVDPEKNLIALKGAVSGKRGSLLEIYENTSL